MRGGSARVPPDTGPGEIPRDMSKSLKLTLDILLGAAAPVVILKYGTAPLGTLTAYLAAALVPVAWVLVDLFVISRRFNFITTYGGASAIMRGALTFWYVDGALFAFKDSASFLLAFLVFGLTALVGTPVTRSVALQGLDPDTPERERQMHRLLDEPSVQKALKEVTLLGQPFVKDDKQTIEQLLKARGARVHGFTLYVVGEGIEKKQSDFAAEVAEAAAAAARA